MSPTEINKAIAGACGKYPNEYGVYQLADYHGSLDAMALARQTLKPAHQFHYERALRDVLERDSGLGTIFEVANATAAQHAEAFLRAKGLWKETP